MGQHHVLTRCTKIHVQDNPQRRRGGVKKGDCSQGKAAEDIWGKPLQSWGFHLWVFCLLHGSWWWTSVGFTSRKSGTHPFQSQRRRGGSMGWSATAVAQATGPARSESWKHLCRGLLQAVCTKRKMAECCQGRDEMAIHWWVHLWLWESICSQQATAERNQQSMTIHWRAHRISEKSNGRQIPDLQEGKETSQSHYRNTKTPAPSLQEEKQYMDQCTRATTEDTPAHKSQETHKPHTNTQRAEKAKESVTRAAEGSRRKERNGSTPLCGESQYVTKFSSATEC